MMLLSILLLPSLAFSTVVHTPFGEVEGFEYQTEKGIPTQVFLGIRYGQETSGSRRFEKAEMVDKWAPKRISAKKFGDSCNSFTASHVPGTTYSEDCLFINVITPKIRKANLPVFFYIHGGFFEAGSSTYFGYKTLSEKVASEGIVVVTINYRLGPFGFLSLGDSSATGNMGLWDQTLALRFARELLPSFGGDVSRITVGGHSAGSASASALQYSPHSNTLFTQSILLSGSSLAEFAQSEMVVEESKKLLLEFGCPITSTQLGLDCLRQRTAEEIMDAVDEIGTSRRHPNVVKYNPRIDGDFFPLPIPDLAKTAPKKRVLAGATDQESALFVMNEQMSWIAAISLTKEELKSFSRKDLIDFIEKVVVTNEEHGRSASSFRRLLIDFYAGRDEEGKGSEFYVQRYSDLNSDLQFLLPLYQEVRLNLRNDWPTFLYVLQHNTRSFPREGFAVQGMYHGDELEHFTDSFVLHPLKPTEQEDHEFGRHFVSAMVNFIKKGDPSSPDFSWPRITKARPFPHASITVNMSLVDKAYRSEALRLWLDTIPQSVSGELLRKSRLPGTETHIVHNEL